MVEVSVWLLWAVVVFAGLACVTCLVAAWKVRGLRREVAARERALRRLIATYEMRTNKWGAAS